MGLCKLLVFYMYKKQNSYNIKVKKEEIWLESMKLVMSECQSVSQTQSKTQPKAMCSDNDVSGSLTRIK